MTVIRSLLLLFMMATTTVYSSTLYSADNNSSGELVLVGLVINEQEIATIDALESNGEYYLPLNIFIEHMGSTPVISGTEWNIKTPLGTVAITPPHTINHHGVTYVGLNSFNSAGVRAVYQPSQLAIAVYIPWDTSAATRHVQTNDHPTSPTIDYQPERFGIGGITLSGSLNSRRRSTTNTNNHIQNKDYHHIGSSIKIGLAGYALGGLWGSEIDYTRTITNSNNASTGPDDYHRPATINNLYWQKAGDNWAMRLGNNNNTFGNGVDNYSGITVAYSNTGIKKHLASATSRSQQLLAGNSSISSRTIAGDGPVGGIAELRINGNPLARVRIGLDGTYEFRGLRVEDNSNNVEVAIFEYSLSAPPLRIEQPFLGQRRSNVGTDELLVEAGYGRAGNQFKHSEQHTNTHTPMHAYAEYGLTNNIAIRSSISNNDVDTSKSTFNINKYNSMIGLNVGLPFRINLDASYRQLALKSLYRASVNHKSDWTDVTYTYARTKSHKNSDHKNALTEHNASFSLRPHQRIAVNCYGTYRKSDNSNAEHHYSASINAQLHDNLSATINRDKKSNYHYDLNWHIPTVQSRITASWDRQQYSIGMNTNVNDQLSIGSSYQSWRNYAHKLKYARSYRVYSDYIYNDRHRFHMAAGKQGNSNSYQVNWRYRPNNYGAIELGYQKNQSEQEQLIPSDNPIFNDEDYFYLNFSIDLSNKHIGGVTPGSYRPSYYGSVITNIQADHDENLVLDDDIQLLLNDTPVQAHKINDSQYLIENVIPGVYRLGFPVDNLPLEYQSEQLNTPTIKVANAAPTVVDYKISQTFGISGQLTSEKQGIRIVVMQKNTIVAETLTGPYGYYQMIGIAPGDYRITTSDGIIQSVSIRNEFLFEVNL